MGGVEPTGEYVLELLRRGKHVVTANKQLVARRGAELFAAASAAGVQLRFEASVCAAIPVIKVLRESLVVTNVHRVLGIVNGTTNFMLTEMEARQDLRRGARRGAGARLRRGRPDRRRLRRRRGREDGDPRHRRVQLALRARRRRRRRASTAIDALDVAAARELEMVIRLVGAARARRRPASTSASGPALVDRHHPLAAVEGAFNAVMLQGDAIREITLEGPGAGGIETASAVIADMASVIGTMGTGFLQNDAVLARRCRACRPASTARRSTSTSRSTTVPGVLARVAVELAEREISIARLLQHANGDGAAVHVVTHEAREGSLDEALAAIAALPEVRKRAAAVPRRLRPRRRGARMGVIDRYRDRLPVGPDDAALTLGEGSTPLIRAPRLSEQLGVELCLKCEGMNPTGSFKDRGMSRRGREGGRGRREGVVCASTGNTAASAAAYAARAGLTAVVLHAGRARSPPRSSAQSRAVGAKVPRCAAASTTRSRRLPRAGRARDVRARQLAQPAPDRGPEDGGVRDRRGARPRAGRARAAVRRRRQQRRVREGLRGGGRADAARLRAGRRARDDARLRDPHRRARAPRRGRARSSPTAASRSSPSTTPRSRDAWLEIASDEGLFCEPSSAAGSRRSPRRARAGQHVVCVLTGHGLKDTAAVDVLDRADDRRRSRTSRRSSRRGRR